MYEINLYPSSLFNTNRPGFDFSHIYTKKERVINENPIRKPDNVTLKLVVNFVDFLVVIVPVMNQKISYYIIIKALTARGGGQIQ